MRPFEVHHGDCLEVLRAMASDSIDSIVTDPPYGLAFMGKRWDYDVPATAVWAECLRVLKPGGYLLAFAGTRTQHRMCVRIEDAGFEIRDMIAWVYGSGFPKSLDVSKAIDKQRHDRDQVIQVTTWIAAARDRCGLKNSDIDTAFGFNGMAGHWTSQKSQPAIPTLDQVPKLLELLRIDRDDIPGEIATLLVDLNGMKGQPGEAWFRREVVGHRDDGAGNGSVVGLGSARSMDTQFDVTAAHTDAARQWQGWGTALKPAMEPITVARKPLIGTVAANVLAHGTGALNIDGCRVPATDNTTKESRSAGTRGREQYRTGTSGRPIPTDMGRWPANLVHDGGEEVLAAFPDAKGQQGAITGDEPSEKTAHTFGEFAGRAPSSPRADTDTSAARFFYCAKASKADRGEGNIHPTVKPTDLMRWLCRLVTPPGGLVLDPFTGSGSTGRGAIAEGLRFVGIEREAEYVAIAEARIAAAIPAPPAPVPQLDMFEVAP